MKSPTLEEIEVLENLSPEQRIVWAIKTFSKGLVLTTSFGIQSAIMLHMATQYVPGIRVIFIDTGYLLPETYRFADELTKRLKLNVKIYQPLITSARQEALYGRRWEMGSKEVEDYQFDTKIEPMERAIAELNATAWLTGRRRGQSETREKLPILFLQKGVWKVNPIVDWSAKQVYEYLMLHGLPYHPLWEKGYTTVGDWHESAPGKKRRECGIHQDYQI
ncbi:MAG TPA: phosphoadenylyl-sulfate reductase [Candidatus Paceibacterota bacterium]|nr:phosphoadenylyl-sulfate reductase [Candidatus Paceibacterota bacterium]